MAETNFELKSASVFSKITNRFDCVLHQELAIERGVKDIQESWAAIQFTVARHFNRGEDRGYTLNPCDEITVKVDEDAMSLQSMAASQ